MKAFTRSAILAGSCFAAVCAAALSPASAEPQGTLKIATHLSLVPLWFNPSEHAGSQPALFVYYALHDSLVKAMPDGTFTPSLAERFSRSEDGLTYEFKLREGLTFHNGDPVTSDDVRFSFERYKGAASDLFKSRVLAVETPDPLTIRFRLNEPWPDFMWYYATSNTGAAWVLPRKYLEDNGDEAFLAKPVGAGPYRFDAFTPGVELRLQANPDYWRKEPNVATLLMQSVPDMTTRAALLKSGETDIATYVLGAVAEDLGATDGIRLEAPPIFFTQWLIFADQWKEGSPWADKKVRQAANLAIDRQGIAEVEFLGFADPAASIVPPQVEYSLPLEPIAFDPERAKQLLAEAGYPDGFEGGDIFVDKSYATVAEIVQGNLQAVGIRTRMRTLERAAFYSGLNEKTFDGLVYAIYSGFDNAGTWLQQWVVPGGRATFGEYEDVTRLMEAQAVTLDEDERAQILHEAQKAVAAHVMFAPIVHAHSSHAVSDRVEHSGFGDILGYAYLAPYEDIRLKSE